MEALIAYLAANPEVTQALVGAAVTLAGSLGVAVSKIGGGRFVLLKRLYAVLKDAASK